jgi:hypothetical protein
MWKTGGKILPFSASELDGCDGSFFLRPVFPLRKKLRHPLDVRLVGFQSRFVLVCGFVIDHVSSFNFRKVSNNQRSSQM